MTRSMRKVQMLFLVLALPSIAIAQQQPSREPATAGIAKAKALQTRQQVLTKTAAAAAASTSRPAAHSPAGSKASARPMIIPGRRGVPIQD